MGRKRMQEEKTEKIRDFLKSFLDDPEVLSEVEKKHDEEDSLQNKKPKELSK